MQRLDNLQGLRAIAFVLIFLSHCGIGDLSRWAVTLFFVFAFNRGFASKLLSVKIFVWLGNLSAYTFLIHQVVINLLQIVAGNKYIVALVSFVITLVGAVVYERIDKAIRKRKV